MAVSNVKKILYLVPDAIFKNDGFDIVYEWLDQRPQPTQAEIDSVTDQEVIDKENSVLNKKLVAVNALGTMAQMKAEIANANSVSALRDLVSKLADIIYINEKL
jgi:hypothetical protein